MLVDGDERETRNYVEEKIQSINARNVFYACGKLTQLLGAESWIEEAAKERCKTQEEIDGFIINYFEVIGFESGDLPLVRNLVEKGLLEKASKLFDKIQNEVYNQFLGPEIDKLNTEIQTSMNGEQQPRNDNEQPSAF